MTEKSGFRKNASVVTLAVATNDGSSFQKSAAYKEDASSAYLSGARTIDIKAALGIVAKEYDISSDPGDYIFEAIRGNTTNVPNENSDGFHKQELLRFDHRLGKQVYRTYELKPHHVNHRSADPKNARGFIVDTHYNDSRPPLDICPNEECGAKTADQGSRDPETGIHCIKCGAVVKDEFVELLVAVDRKKDPTFAQGVMTGILKNGSMGCSCLRTRCNVCSNVAYTRSEFCAHIRNKGKEYDESEPGFNPIAFVIRHKGKTANKPRKVARSFEWCEGVIFDEYSRVHDPADPKAEQYEILRLSSKVAELESGDKLRNESEILMLQTRLSELEKKVSEKIMAKTAQVTPPAAPAAPPGMPPVPEDAAPPSPEGAMPPSPDGTMPPSPVSLEEDGKGGVVINIDTKAPGSVDIQSGEPVEEVPGVPLEEMTPESEGATPAGPGEVLTPEAMGIMPGAPGATAPGAPAVPPRRGASVVENSVLDAIFQDLGGPSMLRFANSYKHIKAEITSAKNIRIFDDEGTLFVVKPDRVTADSKAASKTGSDLAKTVLTMVAEYGIGGTIKRTNAIVGPRLAQVLEYAVDDMKNEERGKTDSVLDEVETDTEDKRDGVEHSVTEGGSDTDHKEEYDTKGLKDDVLTDRDTDVEDEEHNVDSADSLLKGGGGAVKHPDSDTRQKRKDWTLNQSAIDDVGLDHKEKAAAKVAKGKCEECDSDPCECKSDKSAGKYEAKRHAARIEAIYRARLDKKVAEIEQDKETFKKNLQDRWAKAMKLIARRQALNLEYSPLKTAVGIALCNSCPLDADHDYEPMDQKTAVTLIEAAFNDSIIEGTDKPAWEANIDALIDRAASIMGMSDEALMQVEADLKNIRAASIPLDDMLVRPPMSDDDLRVAARNGNLQLNPSNAETAHSKDTKRSAIRQAVGTTKVAGLASISR